MQIESVVTSNLPLWVHKNIIESTEWLRDYKKRVSEKFITYRKVKKSVPDIKCVLCNPKSLDPTVSDVLVQ